MNITELNEMPYIDELINRATTLRANKKSPEFFLAVDFNPDQDPIQDVLRKELLELIPEQQRLMAYINRISDPWIQQMFVQRYIDRRKLKEIAIDQGISYDLLKRLFLGYVSSHPDGLFTSRELADQWNVNVNTVNAWCRQGKLPGAIRNKSGKLWLIPERCVPPRQKKKRRIIAIPTGYLTTKAVAKGEGVTSGWICKKCKNGMYPGAKKIQYHTWIIPEESIKKP